MSRSIVVVLLSVCAASCSPRTETSALRAPPRQPDVRVTLLLDPVTKEISYVWQTRRTDELRVLRSWLEDARSSGARVASLHAPGLAPIDPSVVRVLDEFAAVGFEKVDLYYDR